MARDERNVVAELLRALGVPLLATITGLLVGAIFIFLTGGDPEAGITATDRAIEALGAFWRAVAGEPRMFGETLVDTIPLMCTGLAIALAFRCGLFNIGAEGQYMLGQVATAWAGYAISLPVWLHWLHPTVAILAGLLAGSVWGAVPGLLKAYRGVHEVINTIMMNYIALFLSGWLLLNYMKAPGPVSSATPPVKESALLVQGLIEGSRLHNGLWIALLAAFLVWVFLWKTPSGYEIRAVGLSPGAAEYAGVSVPRNIVLAMALSGALAGLAGALQTLGVMGKFYEPMGFIGYGFDGIAVALVGRNHPLGVVFAALLFGALGRGGPMMQAVAGVPKAVIWIVQGTVIFFVAAEGIWRFMRNKKIKTEVKQA